jgi:hypothetical protein
MAMNRSYHADSPNSMRIIKLVFIVCFLFFESNLKAQGDWSMTFRPEISFPVSRINGLHPGTGYGFEITVGYHVLENVVVHAGWGEQIFPAETGHFVEKDGYEQSKFTSGLRIFHATNVSRLNYMVGAGGLLVHLDREIHDDVDANHSGNGSGWYAEAGLMYKLTTRLQVMPSLHYTYLSAKMNKDYRLQFKYISPGIVFSYMFVR